MPDCPPRLAWRVAAAAAAAAMCVFNGSYLTHCRWCMGHTSPDYRLCEEIMAQMPGPVDLQVSPDMSLGPSCCGEQRLPREEFWIPSSIPVARTSSAEHRSTRCARPVHYLLSQRHTALHRDQ